MTSPNRDGSSSPARRLCVFCGSSDGGHPRYLELARETGRTLARKGIGVVYGGANRGLMGAVADAALAEGGEVLGVLPRGLEAIEVAHRGLTGLEIVDTLHERKARMMELSDGFVALPGGHGTLEELFEVLTWLQLNIHSNPVGVVNLDGYYDHMLGHLDHCQGEGFIQPRHRGLLLAEPTLHGLLDAMETWEAPERPEWTTSARP